MSDSAKKQDVINSSRNEDSSDKKQDSQSAKEFFSDFVPEAVSEDEEKAADEADNENAEPPAKKGKDSSCKKYIPKYKKEWESKPELQCWLSESIHGNTYFYCKFCKKDYRCGISDIHKHMSSKKHMLQAAMPTFEAQKFKFRGLLCPVFTPFINAKRNVPDINLKAIKKYSNFLNECDIKGILVNDIVGEGMSLTLKERMDVTDAWVNACEKNNQFLMVQIGGVALKDIIELAKHARRKGVGAVVLLPDLYYKPKDHLDLIKYIKLISEYTDKLPILYHHNPEFTRVEVDIQHFLLDITGEVDSFVGLIYSTNDIQKSMAAASVNRERFTVFIGTDEVILGAAASGFVCIMGKSLNFLPKLVESICECVKEGNLKTAQVSQSLLNKTINLILKQGEPVAALKAATELITRTCGVTTREPLHSLWQGTIDKMEGKLRELCVM